jgi:hypothetical protein
VKVALKALKDAELAASAAESKLAQLLKVVGYVVP